MKLISKLHNRWEDIKSQKKLNILWENNLVKHDELINRIESERQSIKNLIENYADEHPRIGIFAKSSISNIISGTALILEGLPQIIIPEESRKVNICNIITNLQITYLVTDFKVDENLFDKQVKKLGKTYEGFTIWSLNKVDFKNTFEGDQDTLLIGFTSGTTSGSPTLVKRTIKDFLNYSNNSFWTPYELRKCPLTRSSTQEWSSRLMKIRQIFYSLPFIVNDNIEEIISQQILPPDCDSISLVPYTLKKFVGLDLIKYLPSDFLCITGSDIVSMELRKAFKEKGTAKLGIVYATTQSGPLTWLPPEQILEEKDSVGWWLGDVKVDPINKSVVYKRDNLDFKEFIIKNSLVEFNPNDLLAISKSGQVIFGGRSNDVFLFSSVLISPMEIEEVVFKNKKVKDCVAFGANSNTYGKVPMVMVTINNKEETNQVISEIKNLTMNELGRKRPLKIIITNNIPKGPTNKPLRKELSKLYSLKN